VPAVFGLVHIESTLLGLADGALGVTLAMLVLAMSHLSVSAEAVSIAFRPSWPLAATGLIVSMNLKHLQRPLCAYLVRGAAGNRS
jgi:putative ABC transport system permease protein